MAVVYETVLELLKAGRCVVPSGGGDTGKHPLVKWAEYQKRMPTEAEISQWQTELKPTVWGIVTGEISGVVLFDADKPEIIKLFDDAGLKAHVITKRGRHYYFKYPGHLLKTVAGVLPGLDIRADGGFANIIGSNTQAEYRIEIFPADGALYDLQQLPRAVKEALLKQTERKPGNTEPISGDIAEGTRDATLTSLAGSLWHRGLPESVILETLRTVNRNQCKPPLDDADVTKISKSVTKYERNLSRFEANYNDYNYINICPNYEAANTKRDKSVTKSVTNTENSGEKLSRFIKEWITASGGWWTTEELDKEADIHKKQDKDNRRQIISRLLADGFIEKHKTQNKMYRRIDSHARLIDFKSAGNHTPLAIRWPLGIERYFRTYPKNIIAVAGVPDAGKTAFLLNFVCMNMTQFPVYYFSSEMGEIELASRLEAFDDVEGLEDWNFTAEERSSNFQDVIRPDAINIIDYLEITEDFYLVGGQMRAIFDKLGSGICIIAIQKGLKSTLGRGGDLGMEKPRLYLTMDAGKMSILKCKNWADTAVNPRGMEINYKIAAGCRFFITNDWHKPEAE
jgi:hypothetical protein